MEGMVEALLHKMMMIDDHQSHWTVGRRSGMQCVKKSLLEDEAEQM